MGDVLDLHPLENEPFGRQPEKITVTISGDEIDVAKLRWRLMSYLSNKFASVDFEVENGETKLLCYPFAVND